jgi:kumamolisin
MATANDSQPIDGTEHQHPAEHNSLGATAADVPVTVTVILHRRSDSQPPRGLDDFSRSKGRAPISRAQFGAKHGSNPDDLAAVVSYAHSHGLDVLESDVRRRSVVVRGSASAINLAFGVALHDYASDRGTYRSHDGPAKLPAALAGKVSAVIGLDSRPVPAKHYATAKAANADPKNTKPLSPLTVAALYNFPAGDGKGQTIGIYEMLTSDGPPGYSAADIAATMKQFGTGLAVPAPVDVSVDGAKNTGTSDGETLLDITIAGANAPAATIAVYFTGGTTQNIVHAFQRMIHPGHGDPEPNIISVSYGFGPDDDSATSFSKATYEALDALFQDAANLGITVLVSSGDSGAEIEDNKNAQASFPATEPWVVACGGTTVGNVAGRSFDERAWNDVGAAGHGATGGGVSARYPVPAYQKDARIPPHIVTGKAGRGLPDLAGNASENSGYLLVIGGSKPQSVGGTSAVAPLYAGLVARINANLGTPVGFVNPLLYTAGAGVFRDIAKGPPANNSFGKVTGYPVGVGWDACTGLGSIDGTALQESLRKAIASEPKA